MANQLKLQVLLAAVDKITRPLKSIQQAAGHAARDVSDTQKRIRELNQAAGQIDGYRKVSRSLGITSNELGKAQNEAQRLARELAATTNPTRAMVRQFEQARSEVTRLQRKQAELTQTQRNHRAILRDAGIDTRSLSTHQRDLARQLGEANRALEQQKNKLAEVSTQQKRLAQARQSYDNTRQLQGGLAGQGAAMAAGGAGALYTASRVLAPGLDFGAGMSRLQALTRLDKDSDQLAELRRQARDLGATTSFTANDVAQGQGFMAMAGFDPKAIKQAMPGVLNMAKAGGVEIAQAADIGSNILSGFKLPAQEMDRLGDVLVGTFTRANVDLAMLGETMKYAGPVAAEMGVSMETAAAMAGKLGDAGIQGSMGGTALRAIMGRLAKPPKMAADALKELGISAADAQGNMRDLPDILIELYSKTQGMGDTVKAGYLKAIAGEEAFAALAVLTNQAGSGELQKLIEELQAAQGTSARVSQVMADNAKGDIESLGSAWQDIGIELFDNNNSGIRDLIQDITALTRAVGAWVKANPELISTLSRVFAVVAGLSLAGGALALTIAGLLGPFAALRWATTVLGIKAFPALLPMLKAVGAGFIKLGVAMLTTPIGWLIMGIAALAVAGYQIYKNWDTVKEYMAAFWQGAKDLATAGIEVLKTIFGWSPLGLLVTNWGEITGFFASLPERFRTMGSDIMQGLVQGIKDKLGAAREAITGAGDSVVGWFKDKLGIRSPSRVFAQLGDDTMAGLAVGLARNHDPERQVTNMTDRLKAAGAAITIGTAALPAPAAAELTPVADAQRAIREQLQPATPAPVPDAQRQIREQLQPAALAPVPDAQRQIREQLQPAALAPVPDAQRQIREQLQPATLAPVPDAQRQIREQLQPAALAPVPDTQRQIREQLQPATLAPVPDAQRQIREQLQPAALAPVPDAQRQIREQLQPVALAPVPDAQRLITEQLHTVGLQDIPAERRQIIEQLQPAGLPSIPDATRTIRERVERVNLPDTADTRRRIQLGEQQRLQQVAQATSQAQPVVTQEFRTVFEPGAIVIHAAPGMDEREIAAQVQRQIEAYERRKAAQSRARLSDLE